MSATGQQPRSLGIDVSDYQGNITAAKWAILIRATNQQVGGISGDGRVFTFIRASRGGTTGVYNENDPNNTTYGTNTLSQRYDDPYFVQNINLATSAGVFAGPYHFVRPDVIASTSNSGGIANTGTDEANHMMQMAGPWMRPGYFLPVCDLETGQSQRTAASLTTFCTDFSTQIYSVMGIRPIMYINGNYADTVLSSIVPYFPDLWSARYATPVNPQTNNPSDSFAAIYGPWDDPPNPAQPWQFWQYSSSGSINAISGSVDVDVAQGGIQYVMDYLVPAIWVTNASGQWTTLSNWNSGQTAVAPPHMTGQTTPIGTQTLPTARLPGSNDTVILSTPGVNYTVTLASGTQTIRKLYMREALAITGGSLAIGYLPSSDSTPIAAEFSGPVSLSGGASLSVSVLQVDLSTTFTLGGGTLTFNTINLMRGSNSVAPAKISMSGSMTFNSLTNNTAIITNGPGSGTFGSIDLGGSAPTFTVPNGVSLFLYPPITNGTLAKSGSGTLFLGATNAFNGGAIVNGGILEGGVASSLTGNVTNTAGIVKLDNASAMSAAATLALADSPAPGALNLNFVGTQTVGALYFGTTQKAAGTWAASGATHTNSAVTGSGILNVTTGPASITTLALTSGANPSTYGDVLTFTASVAGNSPTGTVQFLIDGVPAGGPLVLAGGSASLVVSNLTVTGGPHSITATYGGDDNNNPSSTAVGLSQMVQAAATTTALVSSVNPAGPGTNVLLTATVSSSAGTPAGQIVFSANSMPFSTNTLVAGAAQANLATLPAGTNTVAAHYAGQGNYLASGASLQEVIQAPVTQSETNVIVAIVNNGDGTSTITFLGTPQAQYFILTTSDLTAPVSTWAPVPGSTNTVTDPNGVWQFTVTNTDGQRFYRSAAIAP